MSVCRDIFLELTMTNNCNCHCSYCFEKDHCHDMRNLEEEERQLKLLTDFCESFDFSSGRSVTISFWGGEPFLNYEFMTRVISSTCKHDFVRYHIYSNGTLHDKYVEFTNEDFFESIVNRLHIQLSYDGEPHNTVKRFNDGTEVFKTFQLLLDKGVSAYFKSTLAFDMIPHLTEIWDSFEALHERFGDHVQYAPTLDTFVADPAMLEEWKSQLKAIAKREYKFVREHNHPLMSWFNESKPKNCMLENSAFIHNDGNIYVCHGCPYVDNNSKFKIGTTSTITSIGDCLIRDSELGNVPSACKECEATYCAVCHVAELKESGDIKKDWLASKANNKIRCQYFKEFGKIHKLLSFALMEGE